MQLSKWGNSLTIRLSQAVVEALHLKEGDEIEISVVGAREFAVDRDRRRERALEISPEQQLEVPADWKFDRAPTSCCPPPMATRFDCGALPSQRQSRKSCPRTGYQPARQSPIQSRM